MMSSERQEDQEEDRPKPWLVYVMLTILVTSVILVITSVAFSLLMPRFDLTPAAIDSISGYYGPGSVAAWLILGLSNSEFKVLLKLLARQLPGGQIFPLDDAFSQKVDAAILGTTAYPLVAIVDLILQIVAFYKSTEADAIQTRIDAQLAVIHLSSAMSTTALCAHAFFILAFYLIKDEPEYASTNFGPMMRRRRVRLAMWTTIFISSQICMSSLGFQFRSNAVLYFKHHCRLGTVVIMALAVLVPDGNAIGGSSKVAWTALPIVSLMVVPWVNLNVGEEYAVRFAFPRTSAKLSDLDQAAALGVSLCTTGAGLAKSIARWVEKRSSLDTRNNDVTLSDQSSQSSRQPANQRVHLVEPVSSAPTVAETSRT